MSSQLTKLLDEWKVKTKPFPLTSLLILYTKDKQHRLYADYFAGFKQLVQWLGPIDKNSKYLAQECFYPLYTYECQEIGQILKVHPSIIQQEFIGIYLNELSNSPNSNLRA